MVNWKQIIILGVTIATIVFYVIPFDAFAQSHTNPNSNSQTPPPQSRGCEHSTHAYGCLVGG